MRRYIQLLIFVCFAQTSSMGQIDSNAIFKKSKGTWVSPIDKIVKIDTTGTLTITTDSSRIVHFLQPGRVALITHIGDSRALIVKNGDYYLVYSGLKSVKVRKDEIVETGEDIGELPEGDKGIYELEILMLLGVKREWNLLNWFNKDFIQTARSLK